MKKQLFRDKRGRFISDVRYFDQTFNGASTPIMVIKAPRGELRLYKVDPADGFENYGNRVSLIDEQCHAIRAFMEQHSGNY